MTNPRYGAGFPAGNLDTGGALADWGDYCQAAQLAMSLLLDKQQPAARWIEEMTELSVSAVVWSGTLLKIIPYGDQPLSANGASWAPEPDLAIQPRRQRFPAVVRWRHGRHRSGVADPQRPGAGDELAIGRVHGRENSYNPQIIAAFDQGVIDLYGLRTEPSIQAHEFTNPDYRDGVGATAAAAPRLYPQHLPIQARLAILPLEPMDIVLITDTALGLTGARAHHADRGGRGRRADRHRRGNPWC